jgi:multidrug efflux system membrane fusion protein
LIPAAALQRSQQGSFIYVVKPDHTVEMRSVKIAATQGELVAIDTGLKPGELVAIDGLDKLQQGSRVNVQMAAIPPPGNSP